MATLSTTFHGPCLPKIEASFRLTRVDPLQGALPRAAASSEHLRKYEQLQTMTAEARTVKMNGARLSAEYISIQDKDHETGYTRLESTQVSPQNSAPRTEEG